MKTVLYPAIISCLAVTLCAQAEPGTNKSFNVRVYGLAEHFEWKETYQGQQLLKESGPLFGAGGELAARIKAPLWIEGRGEFFLGDVDYDGALMDKNGDLVPYKSTTSYVGVKLDGDLACRLPLSRQIYVKPFVGIGARAWSRTLDTSLSDRYLGQHGYVEDWATLYGIIGCGGGIAINRNGELTARIEARLPLNTTESVDLTNQGGPSSLELKPGKRASLYAETSLTIARITASIFAETLNFAESPLDSRREEFFQPESKSTMLGGKLGVAF